MREVPTPNFDGDVKALVKEYEKALKAVQGELNSLFLTEFERADILSTEAEIKRIITDLSEQTDKWSAETITKAALIGVAATIYALDLSETFAEAQSIAKFSRTNRRLVDAMIADTQTDLLAMTQNVERQAKLAIRKATAEAMRYQLTHKGNATQEVSREIRKRIISATDTAIIDSIGRKWSVKSYAEMLAPTKAMQAHKEASINQALAEGAYYGRISRHGATDACRHWEGKIVKLVADADGDYPYVGDLPSNEIFHPRCKHIITPLRDPSKYNE